MGIIYLITNNENTMKYVGQTATTLKKRWKGHKNCAKLISDVRNGINTFDLECRYYRQVKNSALYNAMFDIGITNFNIKILLDNIPDTDLNHWEKIAITRFKTRYPNGYNLTSGGGSKYKHSPESIALMIKKKRENINNIRSELIHDLPPKFTFHKDLQAVLLQQHPLCSFKTFSIKKYGSLEAAKEAAKKFVIDLEASGKPYKNTKTMGIDLPKGVYKDKNSGTYYVQKNFNGKTYAKRFKSKATEEENKNDAIEYMKALVAANPRKRNYKD